MEMVDKEIDELVELDKTIRYHADLYFGKNSSEISDSEYDTLVDRFETLADKYPEQASTLVTKLKAVPLSTSGSELKQVQFDTPMISLRKALNRAQLDIILSVMPKDQELIYEYKLDGMALELEYQFGQLGTISSRWDGVSGEDVTHCLPLFGNLPTVLEEMKNVPKYYVRGEAFITNENFDEYNKVAVTKAKSPRNSVSGWVRSLPDNQNEHVKGLLSFGAYYSSEDFGFTKYSDVIDKVQALGFDIAERVTRLHVDNDTRSELVPVDGIVIKINDLETQRALGSTAQHPRWAVAYKFPPEVKKTRLLDVIYQVGRTGVVTPVAIFRPVRLVGADVQRCTIYNMRTLIKTGLRKGAIISIGRSGDVIPKLMNVVDRGKGEHIKVPKHCPECNSVLVPDGGIHDYINLRCVNISGCPGQLAQRVINVTFRGGLNIKDFGITLISRLISKGLITKPADIFKLEESEVGKKLYRSIQAARKTPLNRFLKAVSLPQVGDTTATAIAQAIGTRTDIRAFLLSPELVKVPGVGPGTVMGIYVAFEDKTFSDHFDSLLAELTIHSLVPRPSPFTHEICATGAISMTRSELEELLNKHDIEVSDKVGKGCKMLLTGERPSVSKVSKATKAGIPVRDFTSFSSLEEVIKFIKEL